MKQTFSVNAVFKEAYAIMKPKFWSVIGQFLLIYVGLSVLFFILLGRGAALGGIITSFVLLRWSLSYVNKGSFSFDDIFENLTFKRFIYFILTVILVVLAIIGGMILLIIPGIIFAVWVTFAKYLVIEKDLKPKMPAMAVIRVEIFFIGWGEKFVYIFKNEYQMYNFFPD